MTGTILGRVVARAGAVVMLVASLTATCPTGLTQEAQPGTQAEAYRLMFRANETERGLIISSATENGPATQLKLASDPNVTGALEPGDLIRAVDGNPVRSLDDYYRAMEAARARNGRVRLSVEDVRTGRKVDWIAQGVLVRVTLRPTLPPDRPTAYRLQFEAVEIPGGGLRLTAIAPDSPLLRMSPINNPGALVRAEVGDILVAVDGRVVRSSADYWAAMDRAGNNAGDAIISLRDVNTGTVHDWQVQAVRVPIENPTNGPRRVHFLLCGLTNDDSIGRAITVSLGELTSVLKSHVGDEFTGSLRVLQGSECNAEEILRAVNELDVRPQDTVFCYYLGHGAYDPSRSSNDPSGGHFFQIPSGDLMRKTLFDQLRGKGSRLTVLFTDTCNVRSVAAPKISAEQRTKSIVVPGLTQLERLLLGYRGEIDVSASSQDEYSWFNATTGGWFSNVFCSRVASQPNWSRLFEDVSQRSNDFFHNMRDQILQKPANTPATVLDQLRSQQNMRPQAFRLEASEDPFPAPRKARTRQITDTTTIWVPTN